MFNILRKTWKGRDSTAQGSQNPAESHSQEADSSAANRSNVETTVPNMDGMPASLIPPSSRTKRSRDVFEPEIDQTLDVDRPAKVLKTDAPDYLRNHLPEILDTRERDEIRNRLLLESRREQILLQAQDENVIAVLFSTKGSITLLVDVVGSAIRQEDERSQQLPYTTKLGCRTVIIVVDDALMFDQFTTALENSLENIAIGLYTEDIHRSEPRAWTEMLKNDVVVISSQLLLESLVQGALTITQAYLLVITGAQTIKNQDCHSSMPIVQVMSDFYRNTDLLSRPRIFALVSLPSDRQAIFDSKMLKLEQTLISRVFGVSDNRRAEILALPDRPNEVVVLYDAARKSAETRLLKQLHQLDPTESIFRRHYRDSRHALEEVGPCASDLVWRRASKIIETGLTPGHEDIDEDDLDITSPDMLKAKMYKVVKNWTFTMPNLDPSSRGFNVSHKFLRLMQVLNTFKAYGEGFRGIIFVQKRGIALVLADLIRTFDDQFLRPQAIVGCRKPADHNQHQEIFYNFASGLCNLLVATKSIEDLDVPKASIVIRYDLFESQISHAYVRSRTRGRESHLIHMVERGNDAHRRILSRITNLDADMLRWTETLCNHPESSIPPKSLRETINPYHSDSDEEEEDTTQQFIKDPTTNGRIYHQDATTVIFRYAASLRSKVQIPRDTTGIFIFHDTQKELGLPRAYVCTINLLGTPINNICGDAGSTKAHARRSACFKACDSLYRLGLLDCRLVPLPYNLRAQFDYETKKSLEKDALPEVKPAGTRPYTRKQPSFWENSHSSLPNMLYPTIVSVGGSSAESQEFGSLVILTKIPLPDLPSFKMYSSGVPLPITFQKALPMKLHGTRLEDAHLFTIRICRAIMNKPLECPLEDMAYFFLPMPVGWKSIGDPNTTDIIDIVPWATVAAAKNWAVPVKIGTPEEVEADLRDAVVQDRWIEFTRRFKVAAVRRDLNPLSKPADSPREARYKNLFDFCKSKRKGLDKLTNYDQPIVEVSKIHAVMNHLTPLSKPAGSFSKTPTKYLIPELCAKFTIPASTLSTALLMPSVMRKLDDILLVKELDAKFFDHAIREDLLHNAICTPSAGFDYDYERLELLGDAFLKYLSSVYVFVTNPSLSEGALHIVRQKIISNKSLLLHSMRVGLPSYIQSKAFLYKTWQPPNFGIQAVVKGAKDRITKASPTETKSQCDSAQTENTDLQDIDDIQQELVDKATIDLHDRLDAVPEEIKLEQVNVVNSLPDTPSANTPSEKMEETGVPQNLPAPKKPQKKKKKPEENIQWLGDKAIADVTEAIIGAAYISGGREAALQATKAFTLPLSNIDRWSDFGRKVLTPPPNTIAKLPQKSIVAIEKIIGHKFNRPHLLGQAMTHSSIQGYESTSYERLEFIGDAILDFMVIRHIYDRDQQLSPGGLTMLKGAMVSNSALAAVCVWSGLHEYLLFESSELASNIRDYVDQVNERKEKEYTSAKEEGRSPGQYWLDVEPPKALSDVVESVVGAIYISDGFSPVGAETLFDNVLKPFYDKHITIQTLSHHPTKVLFELLQAQGCQQFEITKDKDDNIIRCHVLVHDVILSSAEDTTPTSAARQASLLALDAIEGDAEFMTRTCDCKTHNQKKLRKKSSFEEALERALAEGVDDDDNEFGNAYKSDDREEQDDISEGSPMSLGSPIG